jgi:integrase
MAVKQLASGRWQVRVDVGGRGTNRSRVNRYVDTETEARELDAALKRRPASGHRRTLLEAVDRYLEVYATRPNRSSNTYNGHLSKRNTYLANSWLGKVELDNLDADDLERFYTQVLAGTWRKGAGPRSIGTVRNLHRLVSVSLEKARRPARWVRTNVARDIDMRDLESGTPAKVSAADDYDLADIARVLDAARRPRKAGKGPHAKPYDYAADALELDDLVHLAVATGAREGELAGLRWCDVDLLDGRVELHGSIAHKRRGTDGPTWVRKSTKTGRPRTLAIDDAALEALRARYARHTAQAETAGVSVESLDRRAVFSRELEVGYTSPAALGQRWRRAAKAAGVALTFHDLRHVNASEMQHGGLSVAAATARTGHASARMFLDTYGHHRRETHDPALPVLAHTWAQVEAARTLQ